MTAPPTNTPDHTPTAITATTTATTATVSLPPSLTPPRFYSYPPFFTLQPVPTTLNAQCTKWSSWILSYCRHHRLWKLSLADALESPLFWNRGIGKRLGGEDARVVLEWMQARGRVEWIGGGGTGRGGGGDRGGGGGEGRDVCWVWWRTVEEWAGVIAEWADETGQKNTVLTLYELTESEATTSQELHGMDPEVLQKALNFLVKRGKAQVFGQEDQRGVKFF